MPANGDLHDVTCHQDRTRGGRFVESCDSTQEELRRSPREISWVVAREQTRGRGRRGRQWISPPATGLYLSWRPVELSALDDELLPAVSLMAGVATAQWVEQWVEQRSEQLSEQRSEQRRGQGAEPLTVNVKLKWPNDLYVNGCKLGGVLCEAHHEPHLRGGQRGYTRSITVGVGVNLYASHDLPPSSTSLDQLLEPSVSDRSLNLKDHITQLTAEQLMTLGAALVTYLDRSYHALLAHGWRGVIEGWRQYQLPLGTPLERLYNGERVRGRYLGITDRGALSLALESGETLTITTGEVSLY